MNGSLVKLVEFVLSMSAERAQRKEYEAILETSLATLLMVRSVREIDGADDIEKAILPSIYFAIAKILPDLNSNEVAKIVTESGSPDSCCSFCGRKAPEVRLGAGPNAFICNECVDTFHGIFHKPVGPR
jgi:ClpX C4-type zinc finger